MGRCGWHGRIGLKRLFLCCTTVICSRRERGEKSVSGWKEAQRDLPLYFNTDTAGVSDWVTSWCIGYATFPTNEWESRLCKKWTQTRNPLWVQLNENNADDAEAMSGFNTNYSSTALQRKSFHINEHYATQFPFMFYSFHGSFLKSIASCVKLHICCSLTLHREDLSRRLSFSMEGQGNDLAQD